ncbi:hypothetical protein, partial [Thiolapillus sp.]|uniref:hypothetical protein n=1 Tax=Thiolapillus sp. TaxID=2017437 RepID=UPI003AF76671
VFDCIGVFNHNKRQSCVYPPWIEEILAMPGHFQCPAPAAYRPSLDTKKRAANGRPWGFPGKPGG